MSAAIPASSVCSGFTEAGLPFPCRSSVGCSTTRRCCGAGDAYEKATPARQASGSLTPTAIEHHRKTRRRQSWPSAARSTGCSCSISGRSANGPYCGMLLASWARACSRSSRRKATSCRRRKRDVEPYPLVMLNTNKVGGPRSQAGARQADFLDLARKADVVVENFAVGVMDRLRIGWDVPHDQPAPGLWRQLGLWPRRAVSRPAAADVTIQAMRRES